MAPAPLGATQPHQNSTGCPFGESHPQSGSRMAFTRSPGAVQAPWLACTGKPARRARGGRMRRASTARDPARDNQGLRTIARAAWISGQPYRGDEATGGA